MPAERSARQPASPQRRSWLWFVTPLLAGLAVAAVCMAGYFELAEDLALSPKIAAFDSQLGAVIQSWRTPSLTRVFEAATWSGNTLTVAAIVLVAVAILMWLGRHREALLVALVVAGGTVLSASA